MFANVVFPDPFGPVIDAKTGRTRGEAEPTRAHEENW
jgi:hypothetical protein